ncbi:MAG: flagellar basal body-associated FliL family protein [Pseudomonadota bacterium]
MADDANENDDPEGGEEDGAGKKPGKMKLIILAAIGLVVLIGGGGAGAYFMGFFGGEQPMEMADADVSEQVVKKPAHYYALPEITVNLSTAETRATYLRMNISLEFTDKSMIAEVEPNLPRVMDAFQVYLRELRVDDLGGSAGLFRLKEELQRRINLAIYPARVDDILFNDIKIQ